MLQNSVVTLDAIIAAKPEDTREDSAIAQYIDVTTSYF